jgi:hypothetical protein
VFDEAKEAAKEAAKRASKEAIMSSTSTVNGDVIRCGREISRDAEVRRCLVDSPTRRQAKADSLHLLRKGAGGMEVGGRGCVRGLLKTTWQHNSCYMQCDLSRAQSYMGQGAAI